MKNILITISVFVLILVSSCKDKTSEEGKTTVSNESIIEANDVQKVEPPHWWIGFKNQKLQLLVKHSNIGNTTPEISYSGVSLTKYHSCLLPCERP